MKRGKRLALSNGRRLIDDVTRIAAKIPAAGLSGEFELKSIDKLRRQSRPKISWNVLYLKAYSLVAAEMPELRQVFVNFPWPHVYQHLSVVAMMTINREFDGEDRLFFARFNNPQHETLASLQSKYDHFRRDPIAEIRQFRHQVLFARVPRFLRRLGWWVMFDLWPEKRCSHVGTIGMSFSGYRGVYGNQHLGPLTSILGIDPFPENGIARSVLTFDHRILDGIPATEVLQQIHRKLRGQVQTELQAIVDSNLESSVPLQRSVA